MTTAGGHEQYGHLVDMREALEAMPREIAESVDLIMLVHPAMYVVRDTLLAHVAVTMQARTDMVPSLAGHGTDGILGPCPTAACGLRLPSGAVHVDEVAFDAGKSVPDISCKTCRRIVESINSALAPSIAERLA